MTVTKEVIIRNIEAKQVNLGLAIIVDAVDGCERAVLRQKGKEFNLKSICSTLLIGDGTAILEFEGPEEVFSRICKILEDKN